MAAVFSALSSGSRNGVPFRLASTRSSIVVSTSPSMKCVLRQQPLEERNRRSDAGDLVLRERAPQTRDRLVRLAPQAISFDDERVVEDRHLAVAARSPRRRECPGPQGREGGRCGPATAGNPIGIFRVDTRLDRVTARAAVQRPDRCPNRAPSARRNLPLHEIDAGHRLGDRMLHLKARVHLEKVELAVIVQQEFDRAGIRVRRRRARSARPLRQSRHAAIR